MCAWAVLKSNSCPPPKASEEQGTNRHVMVVGGGITGITAALEAARAGYPVSLMEKGPQLGGTYAQLHRRAPTRAPYAAPEDTGIEAMIKLLEDDDKVTIYLNSVLSNTDGAPGRFDIDITTGDGSEAKSQKVSCGSIIQASGMTPYDASQLSEFSYSESADVITQLELEALAKSRRRRPHQTPVRRQRSQQRGVCPVCRSAQ